MAWRSRLGEQADSGRLRAEPPLGDRTSETLYLSSFRTGEGLQAAIQTRLIAGCGIFLDHAGLGGTVNDREGLAEDGLRIGGVTTLQGPAHFADLIAETGLTRAVHGRAAFCDAVALESGKMIGHLLNRLVSRG
jgi:hypothetical protein